MSLPFRRHSVPLADGTMAAIAFGPADRPVDLVFSHANGFNARTYARLLGALAATHHILAIDMRGHGRTTLPADPARHPGWQIFADDLLALLRQENITGAVLAGHSMGATASLLAAVAEPARVRGLVLLDPVMLAEPAPGGNPATAALVEGAARRRPVFASREEAFASYAGRGAFRDWPEDTLRDYLADGMRETAGGVTLACAPAWESANFSQSHSAGAWLALARLTRPATILRASHGSTCVLSAGVEVLATQPLADVQTVPDSTHFLPMLHRQVTRAALARALPPS